MKLGLRILNIQISEIVFKMTESEIIIKNNTIYRSQRQHSSAVSAISHNFLFSAQFRIIIHSPHNSAYFCPNHTCSHIFLKIALDRIKTKHILSESGTFSSLLIGIWVVFVLADRNLGRFRPS